MAKICMLSRNHDSFDDRIYWKECLTLHHKGHDVSHIAVGSTNNIFRSEHGIKMMLIKEERRMDPWLYFFHNRDSIYQKILTAAAAEEAEVYHFHDWQLNIIGKKLKALPHNPLVIYDAHEDVLNRLKGAAAHASFLKRVYAFLLAEVIDIWEKKCALKYDHIITAEEFVAASFGRKIPSHKITCVHNYSFFIPDDGTHTHALSRKYDVIYSGTISRNRGVFELVEAIKILKESVRNIKVLLIGEAFDIKDSLMNLIKSYGLAENVHLRDSVPFSEIGSYYKMSRIGICTWYPLRKQLNAIPVKMFEYMAFGLPVIFTNKGVAASYITVNNSGILVDPLSPKAIAHGIKRLLDDEVLYKELSLNGMKAVKNRYNWNVEKQALEKVYAGLLVNAG